MTPKVAAIAVVLDDDRVLLVRRKKEPDAGLWGYPGGHVDLGETALDAAERELREETGVIATPVSYLTNLDIITRDDTGAVQHHFLLAAVLCSFESGTPVAADDVSDARWFHVDLLDTVACSADVHAIAVLARGYGA